MHILTGMIVTALLRRRQKAKSGQGADLPRFTTGPIRVAHTLPGRVRFQVPSLVGDESGTDKLETRLRGVAGIEAADVSPVTGSILVRYDPARVRPAMLFAAVARLLGLEEELEQPPTPKVTSEIRDMAESLNRAVLEQTGGLVDLWTVALLGLGGLGVRKMLAEGGLSTPTGLTLVWWATNGLILKNARGT